MACLLYQPYNCRGIIHGWFNMTLNNSYITILIYLPTGDKGKPQMNLQWKTVNVPTLKTLHKGPRWHPKQMNFNTL